ncbi:MAG: GAF domain-containing protein, partial [Coleofasciculus sp. C2-GNP5-27]
VDDVHDGTLTDCHVEALDYYGVKSCAVVSIFQDNKLWGLLSAFQNTGTRHWEDGEVRLLKQVASQLGVALQQADYLQQLQAQSEQLVKTADLERVTAQIISKISQSQEIDQIFQSACGELQSFPDGDSVPLGFPVNRCLPRRYGYRDPLKASIPSPPTRR